jgi:hypothetical protein
MDSAKCGIHKAEFRDLTDAEMPLNSSAYWNPAKAESQTAGHPVRRDKFSGKAITL